MHFNALSIALLILGFKCMTDACMRASGVYRVDSRVLSLDLNDNGTQVCKYAGLWDGTSPLDISCLPGFASWIEWDATRRRLTHVAYAAGGRDNEI